MKGMYLLLLWQDIPVIRFVLCARRLGAVLAFTEMVSVNGLKYNDNATKRLLFTTDLEYPKAVQLVGSEPSIFEHTCRKDDIQKIAWKNVLWGCIYLNSFKK